MVRLLFASGASFELAVPVFETLPAFASASVTVCEAVQVMLAPGASVDCGHTGGASTLLSETVTPVRVEVPVSVTR